MIIYLGVVMAKKTLKRHGTVNSQTRIPCTRDENVAEKTDDASSAAAAATSTDAQQRDHDSNAGKRKLPPRYEPRYWYWELGETSRCLVLTAVLSVCGSGTSCTSNCMGILHPTDTAQMTSQRRRGSTRCSSHFSASSSHWTRC